MTHFARETSQSGAGLLPASFGYDNGNGGGQIGTITTYQGAVTNNNGTLTGTNPATTAFAYDPATGLPTSKTYNGQSAPTDTTSYSSRFQLSATTHGTVSGSNFVYDTAGELTGSTLMDNASNTSLKSSITGITAKGQPTIFSQTTAHSTNATTNSSTNVLTYTAQDQVASQSFSTAANDKVVYEYYQPADGSASASPESIKDMKIEQFDGTVLAEYDYAYDPSSKRLMSITLKGANAGSDQVFTYGYQPGSSLVSSVSSSSGLTTSYAYEPSTGRLSSINAINNTTDQTDLGAVYGYNANDQRSNQTISAVNPDGSTQSYSSTFGYDNADELTRVTNSAATGTAPANFSAGYDAAGNRADLGSVNLLNQYTADSYDSRGNLTSDGTSTYTYDPADRLTSVTPNNPNAASLKCVFQYDAMGNRSEKDVYSWSGGAWTLSYSRKWVYDGSNPVAEFDGNNKLLETFAWGQDGNLLAVTDYSNPAAPRVYLAVADGSGNVVELIDGASGAVAASEQVDPYGKLLSSSGPAANLCPFLWQGHYRDAETGLNFAPNRVELPSQGRWLQRDPSGEAGGLNLYQVDGGDPVNQTDPSGNAPEQIETNFIRTLDKNNVLDPTSGHFLPWTIGRLLFYDTWVMTSRAVTQGAAETRSALRDTIATSSDPITRSVARAGIPLVYFGEGSADVSILLGQGGVYGPVAAPAARLLPNSARALATAGTLTGTAAEGVHILSSLSGSDGGNSLSVGDLVNFGAGLAGSWYLTGGSSGPLNPLNYRVANNGSVQDGQVALGANRFLRFVGPSAKYSHDAYVLAVLGRDVAREVTVPTPWSQGRLGARVYDGVMLSKRIYFEGNTTDWASIDWETYNRKLTQITADKALANSPTSLRVIWFGTLPLPSTGLGSVIATELRSANIPYYVVQIK